ncbi:MAG: tetratricopeptide repeat protein [Rhizobiales bacterium]|nr:tetratricopeptide repeat protein [Hyphomicrobiales bacterium]
MNRRLVALAAFVVLLGLPLAAAAETVEVAPGVIVTKKTYGGPDSEAPFYGFAEKSPILRQTDDIFISMALQVYGSRAKAFEHLAARGWEALAADDFKQAGTSFNQAALFAPAQSQIFHGFAVIAYTCFNDPQFADELFKVALKQPGARATLKADYGHMLLAANRPGDAEPVLEQAIRDTPEAGDTWTNLGLARLRNGNPAGACLAADQADKLPHATHAHTSIRWIWREAKCSGH